jgi:tetratricopeptide (TPR) repeat protein/predicted Ser/Thr protein kinase
VSSPSSGAGDSNSQTPDGPADPVAFARTEEQDSAAAPASASSLREVFTQLRVRSQLFGEAPPRIGRYTVLEALGRGGMGTVFAAFDDKLDRKIAIKVLHGSTSGAGERLLAEARALARVVHPNVVAVHDVEQEGERVHMAMEFVRGPNLRTWLEMPRTWREVVEVFVQAGRGLAAAHAAGVLHRDFKPDNAILAEDGRVRVVDFGLAVPTSSAGEAEANATGGAGMVAGTPAYMPLEQLEGRTIDARSDQFSFCAALFEGLYGRPPSGGADLAALHGNVAREHLVEADPSRSVPRRLRDTVIRGLSRDPVARWPSMTALLEAIEASLRPRRYASIAIFGLLGVAGIAAALLPDARTDLCTGGAEIIARDLSADARARAAVAFAAAAPSWGEDAWQRVNARLSVFAEEWQHTHRDFCEATHVRHEVSTDIMDRRMQCLQRRWRRVATLMDLFARADADVAERALGAVDGLDAPDSCADEPDRSRDAVPAELAEIVQEIDLRIEDSRALQEAGRYTESRRVADDAYERAQEVPYLPLLARARTRLGESLSFLDELEPAREHLRGAYMAAQEAGHDDLMVVIANDLIFLATKGKPDLKEALLWADLAAATLRRLGDRAPPERWRYHERMKAAAYQAAGKVEEALERMAVVMAEEEGTTEGLELATSLNNYAAMLGTNGRNDESLAPARRATELRERIQGPDHPQTLQTSNSFVALLTSAGQHEEALRRAEALEERTRRVLGDTHRFSIDALSNHANVLAKLDRFDDALSVLHRGVRLVEDEGEAKALGLLLTNRAFVQRRLNRRAEACRDLERAVTLYEREYGEHIKLAGILRNLGSYLDEMGEHERAIAVLTRARAILARDAPGSLALAHTENNLALAMGSLGRHDEALALLDAAIERLRSHQPPDELEIAKLRRHRGDTLRLLGQHDEAVVTLKLALDDLLRNKSEPLPLAQTYRNLARAEADRGKPRDEVAGWVEKARAHYAEAADHARPEAEALEQWWREYDAPPAR